MASLKFEDFLRQRGLVAQEATSTNPLDTTGASKSTGRRPYVDTGDVMAAQPSPTQIDVSDMPTPPAPRSREQVEADARRAMVSRPEEPQVAPEEEPELPQTEVDRLQEPFPALSQAVRTAQQAPQAAGLKLNPYITGGSFGTPIEDIAEKASEAGMQISPEARANFNSWYLEDGLPMIGAAGAAIASGGVTSLPTLLAYSFAGASAGELAEQTAKKANLMKWAPGETPWESMGELALRTSYEGASNAVMDTIFLGMKPAASLAKQEAKRAILRNANQKVRPGMEAIVKEIQAGNEDLAKVPLKYLINDGKVNLAAAVLENSVLTGAYAQQRNKEGIEQLHKYMFGQGIDPKAVGEATDIVRNTIIDDLGSLGAREEDLAKALDEFDAEEGLVIDFTKDAYKDIDPRMFISRTSKAMDSTKKRLERETRELGASIGDLEVRAQVQDIKNYDELSGLFSGAPMGDKARAKLEKQFGKLPIELQDTVKRLGTEKSRLASTQDNLLKVDPMKYQEDTKKLLSTRKVELTTQLDDLGKSYKESMDTLKAFGVKDGEKYVTMSEDKLATSPFDTFDATQQKAIMDARELRGTIDDTVDKIGIVNDSFYALDKGSDEVILQKNMGHVVDEIMDPFGSIGRAGIIRGGLLNSESWVKAASSSIYTPIEKIMMDIETSSGSQFVDTIPLKDFVTDHLDLLSRTPVEHTHVKKLMTLEDDVLSYQEARVIVSDMKEVTSKLYSDGNNKEGAIMSQATNLLEKSIKEALETAGDFAYTTERGTHNLMGQEVTGKLLSESYDEANSMYRHLSTAKGNHWVRAILEKADTDAGMANQVMSTVLSDPIAAKAVMNFLKEAKEVRIKYGSEATDAFLKKHNIEPTTAAETHAALKGGAMIHLLQPQVVDGEYKLVVNRNAFKQQEALKELFSPEELHRVNNMRKIAESIEGVEASRTARYIQKAREYGAAAQIISMAGGVLAGFVDPTTVAMAAGGLAMKGKVLNAFGRWLYDEDTTKIFMKAGGMNLRSPAVQEALEGRIKSQIGKIVMSLDEEAEGRQRTLDKVRLGISEMTDTRTEEEQQEDIQATIAEMTSLFGGGEAPVAPEENPEVPQQESPDIQSTIDEMTALFGE